MVTALSQRFIQEIASATAEQVYDFELLYLLCRSMVNAMLLTRDQNFVVSSLKFQEESSEHMITLLTLLLDSL